MPYLSTRDRRARKSRNRFVRPALAILAVLVVAGVLTFLLLTKPTTPSAPPFYPKLPDTEDLRAKQLLDLHSELSEATGGTDPAKLEATALSILAIDPQNAPALAALGKLQARQGDPSVALVTLNKALELSKEKSSLLVIRAGVHRKLGDLSAALSDLEVAARLDPVNADAANRLLVFKIQAGHKEEVRAFVSTYESAAITSQRPFWLLGAAALAMQDGDAEKAAGYLDSLEALLTPQLFSDLLADPFFDPYRGESALRVYLSADQGIIP
jgi:tetratricopeptide (TPR) repeat protein